MLHSISWAAFGEAVFFLLLAYYSAIGILYFRKEITAFVRRRGKPTSLLLILVAGSGGTLWAQTADGNNGINQANTMVRSYFASGTQLLYAVGALVGLVGAYRVYSLMQERHRDDAKTAAVAWFGSCIFLVIVASVIQAFFGL